MSKPQDRVTRSVLNYWSPQGAYPLLRFFAYTRKYILKDQPHSRRVSAPPGECQWDEKIASTNSRKSSCRYAQILDLATLLACFEAGEPIFSFDDGVFFSSSWKLITKLNFTFYLDSLPCLLIWNEKTINEKWSLHLSCFFDSCLLTHSFAAHRHFSPKNSDHGYRWACELMSVVEVNLVKFVSAAPCWLLC